MIDVFDKNLRKINTIRKYTFAQYIDKFREVGTFKITANLVNENLYLLQDSQFYVLFDGVVFGRVDKVLKDSDSEYDKTIEITGQLAPVFFTQRVNYKTIDYTGTTARYIGALISQNIPTDKSDPRYLDITVKYEDADYLDANCRKISRKKTGGYMWDEMSLAMEQDNLGIFFEPNLDSLKNISDEDGTQIQAWNLTVSAGKDRTKDNTQGNTPIVFSQSVSNIQRSTYALNSEDYCNSAVVAGEGEGDARKWFTFDVNSKESKFEPNSGWGLRELFIDARDIQSKTDDGNATMTDEEYKKALNDRADSKAVDSMLTKSYSSTVIMSNDKYVYNRDYTKGDTVTVVDKEIGVTLDAQITTVTKTYQGVKEVIDIDFTYGKTESDLFASSSSKGSISNTASRVNDIDDGIDIIDSRLNDIDDGIDIIGGTVDNIGQDVEDIKQQLESGGGAVKKDIVVGGKNNNEGTFTQKNDNNVEKFKIDKAGISGVNLGNGKTQSFLDVHYADWLTALSVEAGTNIRSTTVTGMNVDYIKTLLANGTAFVERAVATPVAGSSGRIAQTTIGIQRPYEHEVPPDQPSISKHNVVVDFVNADHFLINLGAGGSTVVNMGGKQVCDEKGLLVPLYAEKDKYKRWRFGWDEKGFYIQDVRENLVEEEKYYFTLTSASDMNKNTDNSGSSGDGDRNSGGHQVGDSSSDSNSGSGSDSDNSSGRPQIDESDS